MTLCYAILEPVIRTVRMLVRFVREVVRTVCTTVVMIIRSIRLLIAFICQRLPWPFSLLCRLVVRVVEVIEVVVETVCREVIERVIEWIEVVLEYVYYALRWVCWAADWVAFRWLELLWCKLGFRPRKFLRVCIRVLHGPANPAPVSLQDAAAAMAGAARILGPCNIELVVLDAGFVDLPQFLTGTECNAGAILSDRWRTFSRLACSNSLLQIQPVITVYFVEDVADGSGCAFPGTDWLLVESPVSGPDPRVIVHEIGHLADLGHSDDPNNVMAEGFVGTADQITRGQCCILRSSRFVTFVAPG